MISGLTIPYALPVVVNPARPEEAGQEVVSHIVTPTEYVAADAPSAASKTCSGPCGRHLPLDSFGVNSTRRDGRRSECRECQKARRGPRGKDAGRACSLEKYLLSLLGTYDSPPLSDILSRTIDEVRQVGATGPAFGEQVESVRRAVLLRGCRRVDEVVEETGLSRWSVDRALEALLDEGALETRDSYTLDDEAAEAGRPVTEYHPKGYPRGEGFSSLFHHSAVDDDLL
jgi:hypothetical protein